MTCEIDWQSAGRRGSNFTLHATLKRDRIWHIIRFIRFEGLSKEIDKDDENHDRLWKTRGISEMLRTGYESYYNPFELVATDELIVLF
jgi:hypothetical protein